MPALHLLAGSNGAGKSTYVHRVLTPVTGLPFVNADVIAAEQWPDAQLEHAYEASALAEEMRRAKMAQGESFITETVFSHPSKVQLVKDALSAGYSVHLHAVLVPVDVTVQRVKDRVRRGGHDVPETKTRERYERLWDYVAEAIRLADTAEILDNSKAKTPFRSCATLIQGVVYGPTSIPAWAPSALRSLG